MSTLKTRYDEIVDVEAIAVGPQGKALKRISQLIQSGADMSEIEEEVRKGEHPITIQDVLAKAEEESNISPASEDGKKVLFLAIDYQKDFMDNGSLGVPGATGDIERATKFLYNNIEKITDIMCTVDTHYPIQIFHPAWFIDQEGNHPKPFTQITADDLDTGKYFPIFGDISKTRDYLYHLRDNDRKLLTIWTYHCLNATEGHCLEGEFAKMVYFWAMARKKRPIIVPKGTDPFSEMYGACKKEYDPKGWVNTVVINTIEKYDTIILCGEAASHCLMETGKQIFEEYADRPEVTSRFILLEDCTSPITGCEQIAKDAFKMFQKQYGIKVKKSTDIIF